MHFILGMAFVVTVSLIIGCHSESTSSSQVLNALSPVDEVVENSGKLDKGNGAISEREAVEFAARWMKAIDEKNVEQLNVLFDWNGIIDRSIEGMNLSAEIIRGYKNGATRNPLAARMLANFTTELGDEGSYRLVRIVQRDGVQHAVFRLVNKDSSLNYHDLRLSRFGDSLRADRFFVAITGEELADTIRSTVGPGLQSQASLSSRLSGKAKEELEGLEMQSKMMNAAQSGKMEEAKRLYNLLPENQKQRKIPLLAMIAATDPNDQQAYLSNIDNYVKQFPNDPSVGMVTLDAGVIRKDNVLLEKSRNHIQKWTGGDDYLDLMIGGALASMGKVEEATKLTENIEPDSLGLAAAHDYKLTIAIENKDYVRVLHELKALKNNYGYVFSDLRTAEGFEGFVASPEFGEWNTPSAN